MTPPRAALLAAAVTALVIGLAVWLAWPGGTVELVRIEVDRPSSSTTTTLPALFQAPATVATTTVPPAPPSSSTTAPEPVAAASAGAWTTSSTSYCLRGSTASGEPVRDGIVAVASSRWQELQGTRWAVLDGPYAGRTFTVLDHGPAAHFDVWTSSCAAAKAYGTRTIHVVPA